MNKLAPSVIAIGKHSKLSASDAEKAADVMASSSIEVIVRNETAQIPLGVHRQLASVIIKLHGKIAHFPSKSNISHIWTKQRTDMKIRLYALTQLYVVSLVNQGLYLPTFEKQQVHVAIFCARHKVRFDSHNQCKALGDWLQECLLIDDDAQAEIHAFKKEDYQEVFRDQFSTTIVIQRRDAVKGLLRESIHELYKVATGDLRLYG